MSKMEETMLNETYHDMLKDTNPGLYAVVKALIEAGQSPETIAQRVERTAGKDSVLPGLVEGAAKTIKKKQR
jgi:hypothetical protein